MNDHVRKQLRKAVVARLSGLPGIRVYDARRLPLGNAHLPALLVYARQDTPVDEQSSLPRQIWRELEVHVEGYAADEDGMDALAFAVEQAMFTDARFGGLAVGTSLGIQELRDDSGGERFVGVIDMTFTIHYRTAQGVPGVAT